MASVSDPVGQHEIASRLGVPPGTVHQWRKRGLLPEPDYPSVSGWPAWEWPVIEAWARRTGRLAPAAGASPTAAPKRSATGCKHPVNRRIGDYCGACKRVVGGGA